jgi:excisionase family DNA binding protein
MSTSICSLRLYQEHAHLQLNMNGHHEAKTEDDKLIGIKDLAVYLGISQVSVYRMIERRSIRFYRLARHIRFRKSDVEAYLKSRLVEPMNEYECTQDKTKLVG